MLDLVILSLGFMIHMWALPYTFKNRLFDFIVWFIQVGFSITILASLKPLVFIPSALGLITGAGVGIACLAFQLFYSRGIRLRARSITKHFIWSQVTFLFFQIPAEEIFYRGVFFTVLSAIWGPFTALLISAALSTMITVVSSRRQILWLGSSLMGLLCGLGYYYSQCIWAPILIHVLNDFGFVTLNDRLDQFHS